MATPSFYCPELQDGDQRILLSEQESAHAVKSRRLREGQPIRLLNGKGRVADARLGAKHAKQVEALIDSCTHYPASHVPLRIATAVPKGDRQRMMVDMLTQLGVSQILPLECDYSSVAFKPAMLEKWQRIAIEGCKQSNNPWLPEIRPVTTVTELVIQMKRDGELGIFADQNGALPQAIFVPAGSHDPVNTTILIGPEGGFSATEQALFTDAGVRALRLSRCILRTETAAVAAAAQFCQFHAQ